MNENNQKPTNDRFWLLLSLSALIVITFVYYLPLRFYHMAGNEMMMEGDDHHHDDSEAPGHTNQSLPDLATLKRLPLRAPADRIAKLPSVLKNGVKEFILEPSEFRWEYAKGKWIHVWGYNGQIPGPEIRVNEGDRVRVIVRNKMPDATTVHWHGVDAEWSADGTPGVTQEAIKPGAEFVYEFTAKPAGTHFYHTHGKDHLTAAQQMDMGLYGPFIVEPKNPIAAYSREYTIMLDEWSVLPGGANSALTHIHGAGEEGAVPEFNTFTINGRIFPDTDVISIKKDERILIRMINAGTAAFHPMHTHGHNFEVVALDGNPVPKAARQIRNTLTVNPGETADIIVTGYNTPGIWAFHCHHVHHAAAGMVMVIKYE